MDILKETLSALDVPAPAQAVYADLLRNGSSSARVIATRLSMTRPSVYDQLKILIPRGLVVERDMDGKTEFSVRDLSDLEKLLSLEEDRLSRIREEFSRKKDALSRRQESIDPKIRFLHGRDAIITAMHDMLWDERIVLRAVWPYDEMLRALGSSELALFNQKRIRNGLRLRTIWSPAPKKTDSHIWKDGDVGVERRLAPKGFAPDMAYTVYGEKTLFISSTNESFGFVVQSADFARLMSLQFDILWDLSKRTK